MFITQRTHDERNNKPSSNKKNLKLMKDRWKKNFQNIFKNYCKKDFFL